MGSRHENELFEEELYLAGERVPAGLYRQIGSLREVCLDHEDVLPASLDGRVACYRWVRHTWSQITGVPTPPSVDATATNGRENP